MKIKNGAPWIKRITSLRRRCARNVDSVHRQFLSARRFPKLQFQDITRSTWQGRLWKVAHRLVLEKAGVNHSIGIRAKKDATLSDKSAADVGGLKHDYHGDP